MDDVCVPAVAGVLAGLGVAMPLGPIAALVLREGVVNGFRVAAAAAAGIATVDLVYCVVAMTLGALLAPWVEEHQGAFLVASGVLVCAIGARQLHRGLRHRGALASAQVERVSAVAAYLRFVALTAVNPMTLVYFVALSGVVTDQRGSWVAPAVFVLAVGVSSLAWQLALAATGSFVGGSLGGRGVRTIDIVASTIILVLGGAIIVKGAQALTGTLA